MALVLHALHLPGNVDGALAMGLLGAALLQPLLRDGDPGVVRESDIGANCLDIAALVGLCQPARFERFRQYEQFVRQQLLLVKRLARDIGRRYRPHLLGQRAAR